MSAAELRFDVYGRRMAVMRQDGGWRVFLLGTDGKRRPAGVSVPADVAADELGVFLGDLFHEATTPRNPDVVALG